MWFSLYWKQLNTTEQAKCFGHHQPITKTLNKSHLTQPYRLLSNVQQYWLTDCMEQSASGEANWFPASQEILRNLWNPKVYYCTHKCTPSVPILCQLDPVHNPTFHSLQIYLIIIAPSTPRSPKRSFPSGFATKTLYKPLHSPIRATCPTHLILPHLLTQTTPLTIMILLQICRLLRQVFVTHWHERQMSTAGTAAVMLQKYSLAKHALRPTVWQ